MADYETVKYGVHDGVATIELARPDKLNAMTTQMFTDLGDAAERAATDPGIRVVIVRGQGRSFSAGLDVSLLGQLAGTRGARFRAFVHVAQRPFVLLAQMAKPTIAAVRGPAIGAGMQLALACDLRVLTDDAQLTLLEIRYGIVPDLGGISFLTRLVGQARAKELVWTSRCVEAEEAERLGLANRVVANDDLEKETEAFARVVAAAPPIPVGLSKALLSRAVEMPLETALEQAGQAQAACVESDDHREAVEAFLEKRPPRYKG